MALIGRLGLAGRLAALAGLLLLFAGCDLGTRGAPDRRGGTIVVTNLSDITGVNPLIAGDSTFSRDIHRQVYLRLLRENPDFETGPLTFAPQLAESFEWSEDGLTLTFRLRPDALWSDGTPITAADVVWTHQAQIEPDLAWRFASKMSAIEEVTAADAHTVVYRFSSAYPGQLADVNEGAILPRHAWSELPFAEWRGNGAWFRDRAVASGPFRLESWSPGEQIVLARNERYFEPGLPLLDRVVFRIVPDKSTQINHLLGGEADYVQVIPIDQAARIESRPDLALDRFRGRQYDYICWNTLRPRFASPELRRAMTLAIDRGEIIATLYGDYARPSISPILSWLWAFNDRLVAWPYDTARARRMLEAASLDDAGSFDLIFNAGFRPHRDAAVMIQDHLRRAGVDVRLQPLEFNAWLERLREHDFDAGIGNWSIDTSMDLEYAFHGNQIENGFNFGSYSNPEVDRLIDEANREADIDRKRAALDRIQEILHEEQPYTFLWEALQINARHRRIENSRPNALSSFYNLHEWRVVEPDS